jgi:hypothetical protein
LEFLENQKIELKSQKLDHSESNGIILGELGIILYKYKRMNCESFKYLKDSIDIFDTVGSDKWKYYKLFMDENQINCG